MIVPVILSGGSGTRLWPLSRDDSPKQLLPLITSRSLLQETVLRLDALKTDAQPPIVVCQEAHAAVVRDHLESIDRHAARLILEPVGRGTAPAAAVAGLLAEQLYPGTNPTLLILPADHLVTEPDGFASTVRSASDAVEQGFLMTFGVVPTRAETGYGYIKRGAKQAAWFAVDRFVEKPGFEEATEYVNAGDYYWNSGMFMFKSASYLAELESFAPEIFLASTGAVDQASEDGDCTLLGKEAFQACPSDSIDFAVMERTSKATVTPLRSGWSDVGSWASLSEASDADPDGNVAVGDVVTRECRQCYFHSTSRLVTGVGLDQLIVVDTPDALLIVPKSRAEDVKELVATLRENNRSEVSGPAPSVSSAARPRK